MSHDFTFDSLSFNVLSKNTPAASPREISTELVVVLIELQVLLCPETGQNWFYLAMVKKIKDGEFWLTGSLVIK